jgi:hypothetical protein
MAFRVKDRDGHLVLVPVDVAAEVIERQRWIDENVELPGSKDTVAYVADEVEVTDDVV